MKRYILTIFTAFATLALYANDNTSDRSIYESINAELTYCGCGEVSAAQRMTMAAEGMLSTPYVAGLLEESAHEEFITPLTQTDCILLVESCLAMVENASCSNPCFENFEDIVRSLRYRKGLVNGYTSRIHYTSEWIDQAQERGYIYEVSRDIGGEPLQQDLSFMSSNPHLYKQLADNPAAVDKIRETEQRLNQKEYYYIPKERIERVLPKLCSGDIVAFTTNIKGLDISHIGIVHIVGERVTFIHASSRAKEVIIHPTDIAEYINSIKNISGVRIIRI